MAKKKMGRPPGRTQDTQLHMRVNADFLNMLDCWIQRHPDKLNRTEAIRHLVRTAIADDCTRKGRK